MDIKTIYQPIQKELDRMEEILATEGNPSSRGVDEMVTHIIGGGGKRLRPALTLLAGKLFHYQAQRLLPMAAAIELLHTATLVHDDIIDKSSIRRNRPTANVLWGNDNAILFGDYLFACSGKKAAMTGESQMTALLSQTLMAITRGEVEEGFNSYNLSKTREDYYQHIGDKTASLFSVAAESGAILGQANAEDTKKLKEYGYNLGMAFQIMDDVLDFTSIEKKRGKPVGVDLNMGIITLPVILFLEQAPKGNAVERLFEHQNDVEFLKKVIRIVANSQVITDCIDIARGFCDKAHRALRNIPVSAAHESLDGLVDYVIEQAK